MGTLTRNGLSKLNHVLLWFQPIEWAWSKIELYAHTITTNYAKTWIIINDIIVLLIMFKEAAE